LRAEGVEGSSEAAQTAKLEKVLDVYEAHLATSKFLAGDFFSLADVSYLPYTNMLVYAAGKGDLITSRLHVSAWWNTVSQRPSFQKKREILAVDVFLGRATT
jgi:glutathione S-transferase